MATAAGAGRLGPVPRGSAPPEPRPGLGPGRRHLPARAGAASTDAVRRRQRTGERRRWGARGEGKREEEEDARYFRKENQKLRVYIYMGWLDSDEKPERNREEVGEGKEKPKKPLTVKSDRSNLDRSL